MHSSRPTYIFLLESFFPHSANLHSSVSHSHTTPWTFTIFKYTSFSPSIILTSFRSVVSFRFALVRRLVSTINGKWGWFWWGLRRTFFIFGFRQHLTPSQSVMSHRLGWQAFAGGIVKVRIMFYLLLYFMAFSFRLLKLVSTQSKDSPYTSIFISTFKAIFLCSHHVICKIILDQTDTSLCYINCSM